MKNLKKGIFAKKLLALFFVASISLCANMYSSPASAACGTLPSKYSSPMVENKNQQRNGTCWAFAVIATLETFLKKNSLYKEPLSEQHMSALCSRGPSDFGWQDLKHNGSFCAASAYLTAGSGPVSGHVCPYDYDKIEFNQDLLNITPLFWVYGIKDVDKDVDSIKQAVAKYGAVAAVIIVNDIYYHAVSIVGWDDAEQKWLVKDSAKNPNNYRWIPYLTIIKALMCMTDVRKFDDKLKRYQHDEYGVTWFWDYCSKNATISNVFDFEGNEKLESVMINSNSPNVQISLYLAPVLSNGAPNEDKSTWQHLHNGYVPYSGYFSFSLKNKVKLNKGKYAIIAQMSQTDKSSNPRIGYMAPSEKLNLGNNNPGKSFVLANNKFYDVTSLQNCNSIHGFSIKAETRRL